MVLYGSVYEWKNALLICIRSSYSEAVVFVLVDNVVDVVLEGAVALAEHTVSPTVHNNILVGASLQGTPGIY